MQAPRWGKDPNTIMKVNNNTQKYVLYIWDQSTVPQGQETSSE